MKRDGIPLSVLLFAVTSFGSAVAAQQVSESSLPQGRAARNSGDVAALQQLVRTAHEKRAENFDGHLGIALLDESLVEAAHDHEDNKVVKQAALEGAAAAEQAVKFNEKSSEAHRLAGELLGESIPHVFAGGARYGARASAEIEKAIQLDPQNPNAYVARGKAYFFKPKTFGGDKDKAVEDWKKAAAMAPDSDAAATAHLWLARAYQLAGKHQDAEKEMEVALRMSPDRMFAKVVREQLASK